MCAAVYAPPVTVLRCSICTAAETIRIRRNLERGDAPLSGATCVCVVSTIYREQRCVFLEAARDGRVGTKLLARSGVGRAAARRRRARRAPGRSTPQSPREHARERRHGRDGHAARNRMRARTRKPRQEPRPGPVVGPIRRSGGSDLLESTRTPGGRAVKSIAWAGRVTRSGASAVIQGPVWHRVPRKGRHVDPLKRPTPDGTLIRSDGSSTHFAARDSG